VCGSGLSRGGIVEYENARLTRVCARRIKRPLPHRNVDIVMDRVHDEVYSRAARALCTHEHRLVRACRRLCLENSDDRKNVAGIRGWATPAIVAVATGRRVPAA